MSEMFDFLEMEFIVLQYGKLFKNSNTFSFT